MEYKIEDVSKLNAFASPRPSTSPRINDENSILVYSAPSSLIPNLSQLFDKYPGIQIVLLEEAIREVINASINSISIASPFIEWDGLGYLINELRSAAKRNVSIRLLTRGILLPERSADYTYLEKIKTLLKMQEIFNANISVPTARFEIRDFTKRIANPLSGSVHYEGIHQKMVIADSSIAYIGSGEIRASSFLVNGECGVIHTGSPAKFWRDFFDIFWISASPVTHSQLASTLTASRSIS